MTLAEVKDFLKSKIDCPNWYVGKRDEAKENSITVYPTQGPVPVIPIGVCHPMAPKQFQYWCIGANIALQQRRKPRRYMPCYLGSKAELLVKVSSSSI